MLLIRHTFIAFSYSVIAAACAMAIPSFWPGLGPGMGIVIGGMVLLGCALLHEISARQDDRATLADELHDLRMSFGEVMTELSQARQEMTLIGEALQKGRAPKASSSSSSSSSLERDVHDVVAEVRMLQSLVNQLSSRADEPAPAPLPEPDPLVLTDAVEEIERQRNVAAVAGGLTDPAILAIIQDGLRRDRVDLVFQPIVSLPQRKHRYFEAFTRIRADDGEIIVPDQYIALAEREGLITAIDNMLLFRCVQLLRKAQAKNRDVGFFCNISPYTLADTKFFGDFVEFMSENRELATNLVFEFAQSTIANRDDDILRQLNRLAVLGFRFSMDQVTNLRLDCEAIADQHFRFVKIDADSLLSPQGASDAGVDVRGLKRALDLNGIDLIVEKIESEPTLLELLDYQIDFGQGYLFGEPRKSKSGT